MPVKVSKAGETPEFVSHGAGLSWIAHPEEGMQRASHALATEAGVWLVDPVDAAGLDERVGDLGEVAGVVVLLDRHERDAAEIAGRHGVPVTRPPGVEREVDAPTEDATGGLPGTDYEFVTVLDWPGWHEVGLWDGETLLVPESVGTNDFTTAGDERLGVQLFARVAPPRHLAELAPERVLVGHGRPLLEDATPALSEALASARRRLPRAAVGALRAVL